MKFVGKNAVVDGKGTLLLVLLFGGLFKNVGKSSNFRISNGLALLIVNDFTMNCPPNLKPLTSEFGLNEKSDAAADFVV